MSKRMQNLILEILQAQPSLRDSKTYLNSFAPRKPPRPANPPHPNQPSQHHHHPPSDPQHPSHPSQQPQQHHTTPLPLQQQHAQPHNDAPHFEFPLPLHVQHPGSLHNPSTTLAHPDRARSQHASAASPPLATQLPRSILDKLQEQHKLQRGIAHPTSESESVCSSPSTSTADQIMPQQNSTVAIPPTTSTSDSLADSHTALVKVQGPFTDRQLDSIAEGLVYLKKLGLVSVCVVDHDDWPDFAAEIDAHGNYVVQSDEIEQQRLERWLHPAGTAARVSSGVGSGSGQAGGAQQFGPGLRPGSIGRKQERLRKRIMAETLRLADALNRKGAMARPFPQAVVRVDAQASAVIEKEARLYRSAHGGDGVQSEQQQQRGAPLPTHHYGAACELQERPPLVSDDALASIRSALAANQIPVLAPYAIYENELEGTLDTLCIKADDMMVALARDMVVAARRADAERERSGSDADNAAAALPYDVGGEVDMMPLRLMVINREGGIPSHARGGDPHLSINLASEYHQIKNSFIWSHSHPTALRNLDAISDCLGYMPQTSSGVLVTHRSPRSLIANLITNKAAHSPSLPHRLLANKKDVRHTPTIIRPGLPVKVIEDFGAVDRDKLTALLEASFRRKLDGEAYFARLEEKLDFVIVTGDYQGAAIVTREYAPDDDRDQVEAIAYLDKFAVLPSLQGSGTVDFLWAALRDEVQGLGLLDALNDNGGKGGYGQGRDLVWKSRSNNPVNRWYYERSNGFVRIDTDAAARAQTAEAAQRGEVATPAWQLFWCDAEDKLARLSGERVLSATPSHLEEAAATAAEQAGRGRDAGEEEADEEGEFDFDRPPASSSASRLASGWGATTTTTAAYERARRMSKPRWNVVSDDSRRTSWKQGAAVRAQERGAGGGYASPGLLRPGMQPARFGGSDGRGAAATGAGGVGSHDDPLLTLLPIVAPEEGGRLERWAKCMAMIPSAWAE
ncbi:Amino-acid acetyltransferase, mitochondrial [Thecaphora frezii]